MRSNIIELIIVCTAILAAAIPFKYRFDAASKREDIKNKYGVVVHYEYDQKSYFPDDFTARGSQAWFKDVTRTLSTIETFLSKYPSSLIQTHLKRVYISGILELSGKSYGATYVDSAIYVSIGGLSQYSQSWILGALHHEFSSILMKNYSFPVKDWEAINEPGWHYEGDGFTMLGNERVHDESPELWSRGF